MFLLIYLIRMAFTVLEWLIIIRVIISWIRPNVNHPNWRKILKIIYNITEPILGPVRRLLPQGNIGIDFSPLVVLILLNILSGVIINILRSIVYGVRF